MTNVTAPVVNRVELTGRVSGGVQVRVLPSGDTMVLLRVVVPRPTDRRRPRSPTVDTVDVSCWSASARRSAGRLHDGDPVHVEGALRRRFFRGAGGSQSRYEVEAAKVVRLSSQT